MSDFPPPIVMVDVFDKLVLKKRKEEAVESEGGSVAKRAQARRLAGC